MKHAYELLEPYDIPTVLIHYIGDEKCAVPYAHGNAASDCNKNYIRTCPSVIKSVKHSCLIETAVKSYRNHILGEVPSPNHLPVKLPRNVKQVKNIRSNVLGQQRLSHDALYNLHRQCRFHSYNSHLPEFGLRLWAKSIVRGV